MNLIKFSNLNKKFFVFSVLKNFWSFKFFKNNYFTLEVYLFCNKKLIKKSIEFIFGIKIIKINTLIQKYYIYKNSILINILKKKKVFIKYF